MKKVIERKITVLSSNRGIEKMYNEFYSHDKNNAEFKFTLDELTATKVICLFYFKTTKRYQEVEATIEDNSFTVQFDTSLITTDEPVIGYIYFEKVEQSADVYSFMFNVHVSEIDKAVKTPLIERESGRIVNVNDIVTKQELDELFAKIKEQGGTYDDSNIRSEISHISADIEALKQKPDKDTVYNDKPLVERVVALENKPSVDTSNLVTRSELDGRGYLTQHQSLDSYAKRSEIPEPYNDTELKERVGRLENKPSIDTSKIVTEDILASKGYLTQHQSLEEYAKKSEIPQPYNDTEVKQRLSTIEQKGESYATKEQLASIPKTPQKLTLSGNTLILSDGGGNVTLPTSTSSNTGQVNQYEIHGTGMPNGRVTAPVGTTYVDTAVTNRALKWIKLSGTDNQGWEVLTGDTGWRKLPALSTLGASAVHVRRVNNTVTYRFDGLSWGWFGVKRRNSPGYAAHPSDRDRKVYILNNGAIPYGFRAPFSLIGQIFNDSGIPYGTWYVGSATDANHLRFQFTEPVSTTQDIGDIRVSAISYITDDPWPTTLP